MKKSRFLKLLGYLFIPVIFTLIGYGVLYIGLQPVWQLASGTVTMMLSSEVPSFSTELRSIFNEEDEQTNTVEVYTEVIQSSESDSNEVSDPGSAEVSDYQVLDVEDVELGETELNELVYKTVRTEYVEPEDPDVLEMAYLYVEDENTEDVENIEPSAYLVIVEEPVEESLSEEETAFGAAADEQADVSQEPDELNGEDEQQDTGENPEKDVVETEPESAEQETHRVVYIYSLSDTFTSSDTAAAETEVPEGDTEQTAEPVQTTDAEGTADTAQTTDAEGTADTAQTTDAEGTADTAQIADNGNAVDQDQTASEDQTDSGQASLFTEAPVLRYELAEGEEFLDPDAQTVFIYESEDDTQQKIAYVFTGGAFESIEEALRKTLYKYINVVNKDGSTHEYIREEDIDYPKAGDHYANLICRRIGLEAPVYMHDTNEILRYGVGQYLNSYPPGFGRMILLSAHNNTWFAPLQYIEVGDVVEYNTNYGAYKYRVTEVSVKNEKVLQSYILEHCLDDHEVLVMYTCYPFEVTLGRKTDRLTVIAERIKGYDVKWSNSDE